MSSSTTTSAVSVSSTTSSKSSSLPPLFLLLEGGNWYEAESRVNSVPVEAKTWGSIKTSSNAKATKRLPLHHVCLKLRTNSRAKATKNNFSENSVSGSTVPSRNGTIDTSETNNLKNSEIPGEDGEWNYFINNGTTEAIRQKQAATSCVRAILNAYPNAAKERESKHGCLPLHLAAFSVSPSSPVAQKKKSLSPTSVTASCSSSFPSTSSGKPIENGRSPSPSSPLDVDIQRSRSLNSCNSGSSDNDSHGSCGGMSAVMNRESLGKGKHVVRGSPTNTAKSTDDPRSSLWSYEREQEEFLAVEIMEMLLRAYPRGARTDSEGGRLPLHMACSGRASTGVVQALLSVYPDACRHRNRDGFLPLHLAAYWGVSDERVAIALLRTYPDAAVGRNKWGRIPLEEALFVAGENGRPNQDALIRVLRKHPNYWTRPPPPVVGSPKSPSENNPRTSAVAENQETNHVVNRPCPPKVSSLGDDNPPDGRITMESRNRERRENNSKDASLIAESTDLTFLIKAKEWNAVITRCVRHPTEAGEWLTIKSQAGRTTRCSPLHYILERSPPAEAVGAIIAVQKETLRWKAMPGGQLPIHVACTWGGYPNVFGILVETFPDGAKCKDENGNLPIHIACYSGLNWECIRPLLVAYPKSICVTNGSGSSPLDIAKRLDHENKEMIVDKLQRHFQLMWKELKAQNIENSYNQNNQKPRTRKKVRETTTKGKNATLWV